MKVITGSDHGGYYLKAVINDFLKSENHAVEDIGVYRDAPCDYPDIALKLCKKIIGTDNKGILICGTGIGMSIAANKINGIRAAHCTDTFSARMSREHNDANVLCLGARISGQGLALDIVKTWLGAEFSNNARHIRRIELIADIERL